MPNFDAMGRKEGRLPTILRGFIKGGQGGWGNCPLPPLVGRIEGRAALLLAVLLFFLPLSYVVSKVFDHFVFPIIV